MKNQYACINIDKAQYITSVIVFLGKILLHVQQGNTANKQQ